MYVCAYIYIYIYINYGCVVWWVYMDLELA